MAESLWEPDLEPEDLFETVSQTLLNAVDRDAYSGWGAVVWIIEKVRRSLSLVPSLSLSTCREHALAAEGLLTHGSSARRTRSRSGGSRRAWTERPCAAVACVEQLATVSYPLRRVLQQRERELLEEARESASPASARSSLALRQRACYILSRAAALRAL